MVRCLPLALLALVAGCDNPCQSLCVEMAQYADECGFEVSNDQVQECRDANATATLTDERAQTCIERSDPVALREWWSCDDLAENYQDGAQ
jgi:hypothetical protein